MQDLEDALLRAAAITHLTKNLRDRPSTGENRWLSRRYGRRLTVIEDAYAAEA